MKKLIFLLLVIFVTLGLTSCSSGPNMKEGKWQITSDISMKGVPMKMPAMTHEQCLTKKDMIPQSGQKGEGSCTVSNQIINGDTVNWEVVCKNANVESTSKGSITYSGDSFKGTIEMTIAGGPMTMTGTTTLSGKYLGSCD